MGGGEEEEEEEEWWWWWWGAKGAVQLRRHERHHVMRAEHAGFMGASKDGCPTHKNNSKKRLEW